MKKLSVALKERIGRGFWVRYLRQFRRFYLEFKGVVSEPDKRRTAFSVSVTEEIRQTLFSELPVSTGGESEASVPALQQRLPLGWSHYVTLLSVSDPGARRFYEIEAAASGWSVRELERPLDSSLSWPPPPGVVSLVPPCIRPADGPILTGGTGLTA